MSRPFDACPPNCQGRLHLDEGDGEARRASDCPVQESRGLYGCLCHRTMAQVMADERLSDMNNLATLAG